MRARVIGNGRDMRFDSIEIEPKLLDRLPRIAKNDSRPGQGESIRESVMLKFLGAGAGVPIMVVSASRGNAPRPLKYKEVP